MVLFRDEELKLRAAERAAEPRWKKRTRLSVKIVLWIAALFTASLVIMSTLAGRSEPLKRGIEQYLSQATGQQAVIGTLRYMSFFPVVSVDFENLSFYRPLPALQGDKAQTASTQMHGEKVAGVGHVRVAVGFWDLFFARSKLKFLDIDQVDVQPEILDRRRIQLDFLRLDPKAWQGRPALILQGRYGSEDVRGLLEMAIKGRAFAVPDKAHFELSAGTMRLQGLLAHRYRQGLTLALESEGATKDDAVTGTLSFSRDAKILHAGADLRAGKSHLEAVFDAPKGKGLQGRITASALDAADIAPLGLFLAGIASHWPGGPDWQADLAFPSIANGSQALGSFSAHAMQQKGIVTLDRMAGNLNADMGSSKNLTLKAAGLDIALPVEAMAECTALRLDNGSDRIKLAPAVLAVNGHAYRGSGALDFQARSVHVMLDHEDLTKRNCDLP